MNARQKLLGMPAEVEAKGRALDGREKETRSGSLCGLAALAPTPARCPLGGYPGLFPLGAEEAPVLDLPEYSRLGNLSVEAPEELIPRLSIP